MSVSLQCHFLIGIPGSGKSTLANQLAYLLPNSAIVSTDRIRQQLYGSEIIQGEWQEIEVEVISQIENAIANHHHIIYDATNAKRSHRLDMLQKLARFNLQSIAWYIDTPIAICKQRNQKRSRCVPETVIDSMAESLKLFPPTLAEGFTLINRLNPTQIQMSNLSNFS
ncbi:MAG: ATP-binding protein [Oscillatoria sp. PMC 1051.18]|nr:ATP-binding protein [Oscillatoria sp. PMC 1050.18]MEC5032248.1 ATP-binding protein [Oscillatoria sp. PMC 1051.18]